MSSDLPKIQPNFRQISALAFCRNLSKIWLAFWEIWRHQNVILRLNDLETNVGEKGESITKLGTLQVLSHSNEFRPQVNPNHCAGLEYNSKIITYCLEAFVVHIWVISSETVEFRVPGSRNWDPLLYKIQMNQINNLDLNLQFCFRYAETLPHLLLTSCT